MKARSARWRGRVELALNLMELSVERWRLQQVGLPVGSHSRDL